MTIDKNKIMDMLVDLIDEYYDIPEISMAFANKINITLLDNNSNIIENTMHFEFNSLFLCHRNGKFFANFRLFITCTVFTETSVTEM